jgi:pectinesterase
VTNKTTMMLSCRVVVVLFVLVFVMMIEVELAECGNGGGVRNYISWEDLMVDEQRFVFKKNINHNEVRVIVVDQNGNGHSKTVQGAVDLVPDWNQHRVKIYIFPGIYRFVITK